MLYSIAMAVLLLCCVTYGFLLLEQQYQERLTVAKDNQKKEIELIGWYVRKSLRENDYQQAEQFIQHWGEQNSDVLIIRLIMLDAHSSAEKGGILAYYTRQYSGDKAYPLEHHIHYNYSQKMAKLTMAKDFTTLYEQHQDFLWSLVMVSLLAVMVIGQFLWLIYRRQMARQINDHKMELAHASRLNTMGEMASSITHEIKQPLSAIQMYSQAGLRLYQQGQPSPEKSCQLMQNIIAQCERADGISQGIRNFVRKGEMSCVATDVNHLVQDAISLIAMEAKEKHVDIQMSLTKPLPKVSVDVIQVEQVLVNLLYNALEAITEASNKGRIRVETRLEQSNVQISVSDSGKGIAKEAMGKVFKPFFTSKAKGTGMGLAISRSLIRAHSGDLWIDTRARSAKGATFHFTLPAL